MIRSFIGIDIGTTISKGVLLSENGELLCEYQVQHAYSSELDYSESWWNEACDILQNLIESIGQEYTLFSITVSAMAPNLIMLDNNGNLANETILFIDDFALSTQEELDNLDGTKWKNETLSKLIVLKERSINWKSVKKILTTHSFIGYKLTGKMYCDAATAYEYGNVFEECSGKWNKDLLRRHNLTSSVFPEIISPISIIGKVSEDVADLLGISTDVNVVAGSHDSIASMIGAGLSQKDDQLIYYGTFNCSAVIRESISDILIGKTTRSPVEWTASIPDSGPQFTAMCKLLVGKEDYATYDKMAQRSLPGANGVVFLQNPQLLKSSIGSKADGYFCNLTNYNSSDDMCRAVYEAFPYGILAFWKHLDNFKYPKKCYAAGGGTRSTVRMQIVSDVLGVDQYKLSHAENAVGTALIGIASYDLNLFLDVQHKRKTNAKMIVHTAKYNKVYKETASKYRRLLKFYGDLQS